MWLQFDNLWPQLTVLKSRVTQPKDMFDIDKYFNKLLTQFYFLTLRRHTESKLFMHLTGWYLMVHQLVTWLINQHKYKWSKQLFWSFQLYHSIFLSLSSYKIVHFHFSELFKVDLEVRLFCQLLLSRSRMTY